MPISDVATAQVPKPSFLIVKGGGAAAAALPMGEKERSGSTRIPTLYNYGNNYMVAWSTRRPPGADILPLNCCNAVEEEDRTRSRNSDRYIVISKKVKNVM